MTLSVAVIDALVAAGATVEQLAAAVKADLAQGEERARLKREKDAARQRKSRASRNVTVTPRDSADAPPNDIYSNPPDLDCSDEQSPPLAVRVVEAWKAGPGKAGARQARALDASRKRALEQRRKEHGEAAIFEAIANLGRSPFHCGENDRGWRAHLGWFLEPKNFLKILESTPDTSGDRKPAEPLTAEEAERLAAYHASRGETDKAERVRRESTGPPRPIGQLIPPVSPERRAIQ